MINRPCPRRLASIAALSSLLATGVSWAQVPADFSVRCTKHPDLSLKNCDALIDRHLNRSREVFRQVGCQD